MFKPDVGYNAQAEEIFAEAFASATREGRRNKDSLLFEPGDVVVLNASPWRASDDTIFGVSSLKDGRDEELGMQLVVETSIFNMNAELPPSKVMGGKHLPLATCHERDVQPLANIAQNIHKKLAKPNFVDLVIEGMKNDDALGEKGTSPFYYTFEDRKLARESQVVTSWTIKTDIGAGSSRIDFNAFANGDLPINLILLSTLCLATAYMCWSLRLWSIRKKGASPSGQSSRELRRGKYSRVDTKGNRHNPSADDDSMVAVADDEYRDDRSAMSNISECTEGESTVRSIGSLSTYLARTSKRGREG